MQFDLLCGNLIEFDLMCCIDLFAITGSYKEEIVCLISGRLRICNQKAFFIRKIAQAQLRLLFCLLFITINDSHNF